MCDGLIVTYHCFIQLTHCLTLTFARYLSTQVILGSDSCETWQRKSISEALYIWWSVSQSACLGVIPLLGLMTRC